MIGGWLGATEFREFMEWNGANADSAGTQKFDKLLPNIKFSKI